MKRFVLFALALALMVTEACQMEDFKGEEEGNVSDAFDTSVATFSLELPVSHATKAVGDGTSATELYYALFDKNGEYMQSFAQTAPIPVAGKTAELKLKLVRNYTYTLVFWAQAPDAPYTFDPEEGVVTIDYSGDANDEGRDAFCQKHTFTVPDKGTFDETIYLSRPFAQINFGAADFAQIAELGLSMESTVAIDGLADTYDIFNGTISGNASTELEFNTVPAQFNQSQELVVNGEEYGYVSMNYILAPFDEDKELTNVSATFAYNGGHVQVDVPNVPYQSNFRTNIIGSFFTDDVEIMIIVEEEFNQPDYVFNKDIR